MKIIIAGVGMVGYNVAKSLATENHDLTCIDIKEEAVNRANESLDVLCVMGNCASIRILKSVDVAHADVFIAVCGQDELNMVACLTAKRLGAKHTVARIRDPQYEAEIDLIKSELDIDVVINPEQAAAAVILRLLRFPNALDIETFYRGRVELVGFRVLEGDFITGHTLSTIQKKQGGPQVLFCAVEHAGVTVIPNGSTVINAGDKVYIIGDIVGINTFFKTLGRISHKIKNVMIIGGGHSTFYLAKLLTDLNMSVKIIEQDYDRCRELCELLPDALILHGDGTDQETLITENIEHTDGFIALTGDDEDNLIIALYAKQLGIPKTISKINRQDYYEVISALNIDSLINPKLITAYTILQYIRSLHKSHGSKMEALYQIASGGAEATEFVVTERTKHTGIPLKNLSQDINKGTLIVSILRGNDIIIPEGSTTIEIGDSIIIVSNSNKIADIDDIFLD